MNHAAPLTVIVLNDQCHINGGASRVAIGEAIGLAQAGANVIFLGACGPVCDELQHSAVRIICLDQKELRDVKAHPAVALQGMWNRQASRAMEALLADCNPARTIIHLHGYTKALSASPVRAAVRRGFRVVCTLHDFFAACPNGAFFHYGEAKPCGRTALSARCIATDCDKRGYSHKLYRVARSIIQRGPGRLPSGISDFITLSRRSVDILRPYLPASARYHALENLIEAVQEPPVDIACNRHVVAVGRLDAEKGIELLLEAARRACAKLVLVGDGPYRAQAEAAGCTVTGWLAPAEVAGQVKRARCLVFPSLWYETYGLVVAEAAARGVPAIVSDISAAAERVEHGVTGWVARAGDSDDLARCLRLAQDDALLQRLGEACYRRFWTSPPTLQNHTDGLLRIYQAILENKPEARAA